MAGWMDGWMDGCKYVCMYACMNACLDVCMCDLDLSRLIYAHINDFCCRKHQIMAGLTSLAFHLSSTVSSLNPKKNTNMKQAAGGS